MNDMTLPPLLSADAESVDYDPFGASPVERVVPSTEAQRELWLGDRLSAQSSLAYNEAVRLTLRGPLDAQALDAAVQALVARHESLRMSFSADGTELMILSSAEVDMAVHDLSGTAPEAAQAALAAACEAAVRTPFSLEQGPLYRAALYTLAPDLHVLVQSAHHAVCDGWSWSVINRELGQLYAQALGTGPALEAPQLYSDYVAWEQQEAASPAMAEHVDHWVSRFSGGALPVLELPLDHPRAKVRSFTSMRIDHVLERPLVDQLRKFGASRGTSLYAVMLGGFCTLLNRLTEQEDLVVGIAAAGQLASEMHGLVGHCVNLLPLRLAVDGEQAFDRLVCHCGDTLLDAFEHQTVTYGSLLQKLAIARDPSRLPLVSVLFNIDQDMATARNRFGGELAALAHSIPRVAENFEMFVNGTPTPEGMALEVQFNSDLYDAATVRRWMAMYEQLLRSALAQGDCPVSRLNLLAPEDRAALAALQPAATPLPQPALMHGGFVAQARLHPARGALKFQGRSWSYGELEQRANRLARALRERGIARGRRVGICLERGPDLILAVLAVLKSGAAYVPLDPAFPQARLDLYAQDAGLDLLLTHAQATAAPKAWCADAQQRLFDMDGTDWTQGAGDAPVPDASLDAQPEDAAYIIYTSGSTGRPKGVCVPHRAVANLVESMRKAPGIGPDDRLAAVTTLSFDMAVPEFALPLGVGAEIVLVPREVAMDGTRLRQLLEDERVTILQATPGMWRLLIDAQWFGPEGFRGWIGAESVPAGLALDLLGRCSELWNLYGPTETTVWSTVWRMERAALEARGVSIGQPMDNTSVWILDRHLQPCPVGVPGEICIGGAGVTLGYLERPELSAERFVLGDPGGEPALIYRTGDRGRWRNDGLLEHMGRFDFQVKVRGYRIELGEIEARCNEVPGVTRSVVVTREDRPGDVRLVAYVACAASHDFDAAVLDTHLRATLPKYMLPQHVVALDALPQLPNGKIDRKSLPAPQAGAEKARGERVPPRNPQEAAVLAEMETVLNLPGLSVTDDFFSLGGHSLLAARLATLLGRRFELTVPLVTVFEAPTAERLASAIDALAAHGAGGARAAIVHQAGRTHAPLTPAQERIVFVEQLYPGRSVYNTPSGHRFKGALDVAHFEAAFREMVSRQPALRTTFGPGPRGESMVQRIAAEVDFELPLTDLSHLAEPEREEELHRRMQETADRLIDIENGPLFHAALYRLGPLEHAFVFVPHHLVWDGWSFDLYQHELSALYLARLAGQPHGLPAPTVTLGDYAAWLDQWLASPEYAAQLDFWKRRFETARPPRALGTDLPRQSGMSGLGAMHVLSVDTATTQRLQEAARGMGVTLSMLTLAAFAMMMARVIDSESVVIANPVRGRESPALESAMGFFNNVLPLPFDVDPEQPFSSFARQVKAQMLAAMPHQQVPFERLVTEPEFGRHATDAGLYQAMFSYQDARERPAALCGLDHQPIHLLQRGATDDLGLWLMEEPWGLEGAVNFNADIFLPETGLAFRDRYLELLAAVAADPGATVAELYAAHGSASAARLARLSSAAALAAQAPVAPAPVAATDTFEALLPPEQAELAQIWARVLCIDVNEIRARDNFFDLGGDSLLAMRAVSLTEQTLGLRVEPRRYVFETLAQLAAGIQPGDSSRNSVAMAVVTQEQLIREAAPARGLLGRVVSAFSRKSQR